MKTTGPRVGVVITLALALLAIAIFFHIPHSQALAPGGTLGGYVWNDVNNNNQADAGEERVAAAAVSAHPLNDATAQAIGTTADSQGAYSLALPEGSWSIFASYYVQANRSMTYTITAVDVVAGQQTNLDLGLHHPTAHAYPTAVDAKIEILWPHDRQGSYQPVTQAELANIAAYLFVAGTDAAVPCDFDPIVRLWQAQNASTQNQASAFVGIGQRQRVTVDGKTFNRWVFNDVDVSAARDPLSKVFFYVTVDGVRTYHNVWSHGADARTYFPLQDIPTAVVSGNQQSEPVDARIEIVWPHDEDGNPKPVSEASLANVGVDLFQYGTLRTVPVDWNPTVKLYRALNNGTGVLAGTGQKTMITRGPITWPRWVFNNVDVSQAGDSLNKYYFYVAVDGVTTNSNVWSHGADARTWFPDPDVPSESCQ